MATYTELYEYYGTAEFHALRNKVKVAVAIKAKAIGDETSPTADEITWAQGAVNNPASEAEGVVHYVLAANSGRTIAQINNAPDSGENSIQENVDDAVDKLLSK